MQTVSSTYNSLYAQTNHWFETCLYIGPSDSTPTANGNNAGLNARVFAEDQLLSVETIRRVFSNGKPEIGCCVAGEISIEMICPTGYTIPRMAKLVPYTRVVADVNGTETVSEWLQKGVFYIDTRETAEQTEDLSTITIKGFDDMLKAGKPYAVTNSGVWPKTDILVVQECAAAMGVSLHPNVTARITNGYNIPSPEDYTYREALGFIAAMYAGNFIMDDLGRLKLLYLNES